MFEGEQTNVDNFEAVRVEKIRRQTLLELARALGGDEENAKDGIESMLQMTNELAEEFTAESVEELTKVNSENVDEEPIDAKLEAEKGKKIGRIEKIGAYFLPVDGSKKSLEFAVGAQVLAMLREEPGDKSYVALQKRLERWNMP